MKSSAICFGFGRKFFRFLVLNHSCKNIRSGQQVYKDIHMDFLSIIILVKQSYM